MSRNTAESRAGVSEMGYLKNGRWDIDGMFRDNRTMTVAEARTLGNKDPVTPNTSKVHDFVAVDAATGFVVRSSWTYNRVIQNGGIRYVIVHRPTERIVRGD